MPNKYIKGILDRISSIETYVVRLLDRVPGTLCDTLDFIRERLFKIENTIDIMSRHQKAAEEYEKDMHLLIEALAGKYDKGTIILYDETMPRGVLVVQNGETICSPYDGTVKSLYFSWDDGEFPTLEIQK